MRFLKTITYEWEKEKKKIQFLVFFLFYKLTNLTFQLELQNEKLYFPSINNVLFQEVSSINRQILNDLT